MKIGILTFHSAFNFGAVLQCHGLYEIIKKMGHEVHVIDYRPNYLCFSRPTLGIGSFVKHPCRVLKALPFVFSYRKHFDRFVDFIGSNWTLSELIRTPEELSGLITQYDLIVVGSDQVWNVKHNGNDGVWYGILENSKSTRWISYAASAGDCFVDTENDKHANALIQFSHIAVREQKLNNELTQKIGRLDIKTVLDPTLLATNDIWRKWFYRKIKGRYIVVYQARADDNVFRISSELSKQLGVD